MENTDPSAATDIALKAILRGLSLARKSGPGPEAFEPFVEAVKRLRLCSTNLALNPISSEKRLRLHNALLEANRFLLGWIQDPAIAEDLFFVMPGPHYLIDYWRRRPAVGQEENLPLDEAVACCRIFENWAEGCLWRSQILKRRKVTWDNRKSTFAAMISGAASDFSDQIEGR